MNNIKKLLGQENLKEIKNPIEANYYTFGIKKKSGKIRKITAPSDKLKAAQNIILHSILYKGRPHASATGFIPGYGIGDGARQHVGQKALLNIDLKNFFPSVEKDEVIEVFREATERAKKHISLTTLSEQELDYLAELCCYKGGLPQGAPTSPVISNLACFDLDRELYGYSLDNKLTYTRYADDMTFSHATGDIDLAHILADVTKIIEDFGLVINRKKTRFQRANKQMSVTGIVVNDRTNVSKVKRRKFRAKLHNLLESGEKIDPDEKQKLRGYANWIDQVNPQQGKFFIEQVKKIPVNPV